MTDGRRMRWGLLAAGHIAEEFVASARVAASADIVAVASRDLTKAKAFARRHGIVRAHGSYAALLADPEVDVVYISTPHSSHAEWAVRAAEAGKHVLCEKPLTVTAAEAQTVIDAAARHDVFCMEAFMWRPHPLTDHLVAALRDGVVGEVRGVDVVFAFDAGRTPPARLVDPALAGGGILDVGCYCVSAALLVATTAAGAGAPVEPLEVTGMARHHPVTGVDTAATALLRFPGGLLARLACGFDADEGSRLVVTGTTGQLELPVPPWRLRSAGPGQAVVRRRGHEPEVTTVEAALPLFAYEIEAVAEHLDERQAPQCSWAESLATMRTLDRWRAAVR